MFTFGAVYPWAYWPLALLAAALGVTGLLLPVAEPACGPPGGSALAISLVVLAVTLQIVPVPDRILATISPLTPPLLSAYEFGYASDRSPSPQYAEAHVRTARYHSISISVADTCRALALFASFAILFLGCVRMLQADLPRVVVNLAAVGLAVALVGIAQAPGFDGRIYGFWQPIERGEPFGPFVNRNHFAGWMLMVLGPTVGFCNGAIARGSGRAAGCRDSLLWLSSRAAGRLILTGFAAIIMATSLVLSRSRSGTTCLVLALTTAAVLSTRQRIAPARRLIAGSYLVFVIVGALAWAGFTSVGDHFVSASWGDFGQRSGIWADTLDVIRTFPVTGTGLNTFRTAMLFYQRQASGFHYAEAHNDYLQLTAEGGALLVLPAILLVIVFAREVRRRFNEATDDAMTYWIRVGAVTAVAAIALQEAVDFSLQMPGNAVLFVVLCAIAVHKPAKRDQPSPVCHEADALWRSASDPKVCQRQTHTRTT